MSVIILIVLIIAYAMFKPSRKGTKGGKNGSVSWSAAANRKLKPLSEYRQMDEAFDETELTSKLSNLYVQMQDCWQKKDISSIRPYCTDAFYTQMDNQLQRKKQQGQTKLYRAHRSSRCQLPRLVPGGRQRCAGRPAQYAHCRLYA